MSPGLVLQEERARVPGPLCLGRWVEQVQSQGLETKCGISRPGPQPPVRWEGGGVPSPAWFVGSCPPVHGAFSLCASLSPNFPFLQGHDYVVIVPNLNDLVSTW